MHRMVQVPARIPISPADRPFVSTTTSAGTSREHVTIWQSSSKAVGGARPARQRLWKIREFCSRQISGFPRLFKSRADARCGAKADLANWLWDVRLAPDNAHRVTTAACPLVPESDS